MYYWLLNMKISVIKKEAFKSYRKFLGKLFLTLAALMGWKGNASLDRRRIDQTFLWHRIAFIMVFCTSMCVVLYNDTYPKSHYIERRIESFLQDIRLKSAIQINKNHIVSENVKMEKYTVNLFCRAIFYCKMPELTKSIKSITKECEFCGHSVFMG